MDWLINTKILSHPANWLVVGAFFIIWAFAGDLAIRHWPSSPAS